eukprot:TRINITY_DN75219_c0_g1_i1.p1 TRINITY_DN75219_c0_g1~~TRINITY_DN75219_c0_g1_i1.p1  ORF type:complete len:160 (-),score=38.35 TRINITY_DN75219_c0_g1_i1:204-683(-)
MARIFGRIGAVREWYGDLSVGEKGLVAMAIGNVIGTMYGTHVRRSKRRFSDAEFMVATTYVVPAEKKKAFEAAWSDAARLAQRQPGYEWTRTYKSLDWEESPFNYISFRLWNEEASFTRLTKLDPTWKELMVRLEENVTKQESAVYKTLVDDSVRRIIY